MPTETQLENLLSLTREIKTMMEAQQRNADLSAVNNKLHHLSHEHESIRRDIQQILLQLAQAQAGAAD